MQIASNTTEKMLSTVFSKFSVEKALMLEFDIAYIANRCFGSDFATCKYCTVKSCTQENENCVLYSI